MDINPKYYFSLIQFKEEGTMKRLLTKSAAIMLAILLAGCSASTGMSISTPVETTAVLTPSASPTAKPTVTPTPIPSLTAPPEPVFIVSDEVWEGSKEIILPDGDWSVMGLVSAEPGTEILLAPYEGMISYYHSVERSDKKFQDYLILTVIEDKSDDQDILTSKPENYPLVFGALDIKPLCEQYSWVKKGQPIGIINSEDLGLPPEQQEEYGGYNLGIFCPIDIREYGVEEPFSEEMTLRDKVKFFVDLAEKNNG